MLNEYFTRMVEIVFAHKGTLDKFVGDMVMALFGAPLDDADHAEHAVDAALEMIRRAEPAERAVDGRRAAGARHRHRHQHRADDCRQHRVGGDHELHRHRRCREPRLAARIAEQGVRHPDYHQRRYTRRPCRTDICSGRSATSWSKARRRPVAIFEVDGEPGMNTMPQSPAMRRSHDSLILVVDAGRQLARVRAARRPPEQGAEGTGAQAEVRRPEHHRGGRDQDRRRRQREDPRSGSASCRIRRSTSTSRSSARCWREQTDAAEAAVDVHRARHRRRQRVRGARRVRAHHARRARADQERSGAGRRARPRDRRTSRRSTP